MSGSDVGGQRVGDRGGHGQRYTVEEQVMVRGEEPVAEPEDLVEVTLSADPMEIEAGGTTTITATANRAVTADDERGQD